jgi:flagellar export protein FliJ
MKKFTFNLQPVLDHRLLLEEQEQEKLFRIQQTIFLAECEKQRVQEEIDRLRSTMARPSPGEIDLEEIRDASRYLEKLGNDLTAIAQRIVRLENERRRQAEELLEARRKREVLDNLKEKSLTGHEREVRSMEQKLHDELSAVKFKAIDEQNLPAAGDSEKG